MKKCNICNHDIANHYLKDNGKVVWTWGKDRFGKKYKECACIECEEYYALHATFERV